jgi:uncharacterized protein (TIGR00299 family) protein
LPKDAFLYRDTVISRREAFGNRLMHFHLDPLGGIAGDMFVAAVLDAYPEHARTLDAQLQGLKSGLGFGAERLDHHDGTLGGSRWQVSGTDTTHGHDHTHAGHSHHSWAAIRGLIEGAAALADGSKHHALAIFGHLARAEAKIHCVAEEDVAFHEVGALDSIADIVGAGILIDALGTARWTVGALPLGSGRVRTAHGWLPVPAPATAALLDGFTFVDDGIGGERVTPTGAAILRHLCRQDDTVQRPAGRLIRCGYGFGTRRLAGTSNCLRLLAMAPATASQAQDETLALIAFEIDDQSPEDLAIALDRLRELPYVRDVLQMAALGKKGRLTTHIQLLADPARREEAITACFLETTTLGLRHAVVDRRVLPRTAAQVETPSGSVRVKRAIRPGGVVTTKIEADELAKAGDRNARTRLRRAAEDDASST